MPAPAAAAVFEPFSSRTVCCGVLKNAKRASSALESADSLPPPPPPPAAAVDGVGDGEAEPFTPASVVVAVWARDSRGSHLHVLHVCESDHPLICNFSIERRSVVSKGKPPPAANSELDEAERENPPPLIAARMDGDGEAEGGGEGDSPPEPEPDRGMNEGSEISSGTVILRPTAGLGLGFEESIATDGTARDTKNVGSEPDRKRGGCGVGRCGWMEAAALKSSPPIDSADGAAPIDANDTPFESR